MKFYHEFWIFVYLFLFLIHQYLSPCVVFYMILLVQLIIIVIIMPVLLSLFCSFMFSLFSLLCFPFLLKHFTWKAFNLFFLFSLNYSLTAETCVQATHLKNSINKFSRDLKIFETNTNLQSFIFKKIICLFLKSYSRFHLRVYS